MVWNKYIWWRPETKQRHTIRPSRGNDVHHSSVLTQFGLHHGAYAGLFLDHWSREYLFIYTPLHQAVQIKLSLVPNTCIRSHACKHHPRRKSATQKLCSRTRTKFIACFRTVPPSSLSARHFGGHQSRWPLMWMHWMVWSINIKRVIFSSLGHVWSTQPRRCIRNGVLNHWWSCSNGERELNVLGIQYVNKKSMAPSLSLTASAADDPKECLHKSKSLTQPLALLARRFYAICAHSSQLMSDNEDRHLMEYPQL